MAWAPLLFAILVHGSGSLVQAALTQPASVSANPGETVTISCSGLDDSSYVGWYQQKVPGTAPLTVLYMDTNRPSGIPSRFSGSASGSTGTLTISGVQAEDEAIYYCGGSDSSNTNIFGSGTTLTVLGQPKVVPTVNLFPPSREELAKKNTATLVCLVGDFYPGSVQVSWLVDGKAPTSGVETSGAQRQSNNKYMASSYLSLSSSEWNNHSTYTCKVSHEAGNVEKILNRSQC